MERRRREWDQHVTGMDAERLVKISWDNIPVGRSPGGPKRRWIKTREIAYKEKEEEFCNKKNLCNREFSSTILNVDYVRTIG